MSLRIAIAGRPNVGKSTLFNRLVGRKIALVDDQPGVTRDRREAPAKLFGLEFTAIDTAGVEDAETGSLSERMRRQTESAIADADLTLFVIDARAGVTPFDEAFSALLRKSGRPVILLANKCEGRAAEAGAVEAWRLGLGEPLQISAEHGMGLADLHEVLRPFFKEAEPEPEFDEDGAAIEAVVDEDDDPTKPVAIAIVGRPNAGKSTLVNRLIGQERMLTGPEAGITRDAITVQWRFRGRNVALVDTAGIRKRARVVEKVEKLSVADALRVIRYSEVIVLLLDAEQPFEKQDLQLADLIVEEGRAIVIGVNKWDAVENGPQRRREIDEMCERLLPQLRGVPVVPVSALTGRGLDKLIDAAIAQRDIWSRRVSTGQLNRWFMAAMEANPPPAVSGRRVKMRFLTQAATRPPTFVTFCTRPEAVPESYRRYLVNALRERFKLPGVPIRLMLRQKENPFDKDKS